MFSATTEYALRAMSCLALTPGELVPTTTLAKLTKVPGNYLAKVLQQLGSAGLITGRRGVGGGYRLAKPAKDISLLEIINAVGVLKRIETCPLGLANHGPNLCPLHRTLDRGIATLIAQYEGITLQHLMEDPVYQNKPLCDASTTIALTVGAKPLM